MTCCQAAILRGNIEETEAQKLEEEHIAKSLKQNVEKLSKVADYMQWNFQTLIF